MRIFSFALGLTLVAAPASWAWDEPDPNSPPAKDAAAAKDDEKSVAEQIEARQTEFAQKRQDLVKRFRAAQDDAERQKILDEFNGLQADLMNKYAIIVEKHPDDDAIFPALQLLLNSDKHAAKASELLLKHHLDKKQIGALCLQFGMQGASSAEPFLRGVAEKSKSDETKALALLGLGQMLMARSNEDGLDDAERNKLRSQAVEALKKVVKHYPDVEAYRRKAGDWAETVLFEVERLSVGMTVPDLAGEDLEGEEFKLSDYRGKAVLLDFWAHW